MIFTTDKAPYTAIEPPFDIPESWEWVRLENILQQLTDGTHSTPKYTQIGIPFLSVKNMSNGKLSFSNTKYISENEHIELSKRCKPEKGDILLSKVGTTGIPVLIDTDKEFSIFVSLALLKLFPNTINPNYLVYLIQSPFIQIQAKENTRGVGNKNWVLASINKTIIPLPPLNEQHKIVAKIEELFPFIEQYDKQEQALTTLNKNFPEQLKKSILQAAIQGKLTEQLPTDEPASELLKRIEAEKVRLIAQGKLKKPRVRDNSQNEKFDPPFEIPQGWEWTKLESVILQNIGGGTPLKSVNEYWNGNISWASVKDLEKNDIYLNKTSDFISESGLKNSSSNLIPKDNIIICTRMGLGKIAINQIDVAINQDLRGIILSQEVNKLFFIYFFKTLNLQGQGLTVKGLPVDTLNNILFPLPPFEEQKRIVKKVELLLSQIERL